MGSPGSGPGSTCHRGYTPLFSPRLHGRLLLLFHYQDLQCDVSLLVDPTSVYQDWRQQCAEYLEKKQNINKTQTINFSSFQQALLALNSTNFNRTNISCVEMLVSDGNYTVTSEVIIEQNVKIVAKVSGKVFVNFNISTPSNPGRVFNVINFSNADFVMLKGIHFFNSPGIITIENIAYVHVLHCHFR